MKNISTITILALLTLKAATSFATPVLSAGDSTNIIVAQNAQNKTLNSTNEEDKPVTMKDLKEALTMTVEVTGNKSVSTEEITSVIKPFLKNTITEPERHIIKEAIQNIYTNKGYPAPAVSIDSVGFSVKVNVTEN